MDNHFDYEAAHIELAECLFCLGVSDSIQSLSLIPIKDNQYYKLGVIPSDPEADVVFSPFKMQGVVDQLDLEPISARHVQLTSIGSAEFAKSLDTLHTVYSAVPLC
ncbi:hypothetical protein GYMLUDRAFT_65344 [Collybiopsis luxurians FD-317 M1]|uniref:Uncharacterized protein n=1 Tax=Collybiopsis luxurians FD-317 M1 TaxID=944289 RepID=A0A0D0BLJ7_9AGAR|nr:hypothetical protein GYMLUDRAFT_65344 [Collybiopsis luxurians FD-317 M1]